MHQPSNPNPTVLPLVSHAGMAATGNSLFKWHVAPGAFLCITLLLQWTASPSLAQLASLQPEPTIPTNAQAEVGMAALSPLPTIAESSEFQATATGAEVETFLRRLTSQWPESELTSLGQTIEGRPIWAVVVEPQLAATEEVDEGTKTPEKEGASIPTTPSTPLTVLMLGGIHAGECDGKEALLALARDMAFTAPQEQWWREVRLIFVPNFNADANERRSPHHRPGQAGPVQGMGLRENAQGLDLNRDFIKLESPEVRSLVAAINQYDVDILIDTHTTNGSLHQYQLTYDIPHNPATPRTIDRWLRSELMPSVKDRMAEAGFSAFYYGNFDKEHRNWSTYGHEPRYSTEYMGLRGKIGILAESYSYAPYRTRTAASHAFVRRILQKVSENVQAINSLLDQSANERPAELPIRAELAKTAEGVPVLGFVQQDGTPPTGPYGPDSATALLPQTYITTLNNRAEPTLSVALPAAYAIPAQYAWAVGRLQRHGIHLLQLTEDFSTSGPQQRIVELKKTPTFQGHRLLDIEVEPQIGGTRLQTGDYIVDTDQPLGALAGYLLEVESDDSLAKWNFFDPDLAVGGLYPVVRLEDLPQSGSLQAVESVAATERLSLERLMSPQQAYDYSGGKRATASWLKESRSYVVGDGGKYTVVDAASGAVRELEEVQRLRDKLSQLDAFTHSQAVAAATIDVFDRDWRHALIHHQQDLYYFEAQADIARQLTHSPDSPEQLAELNPPGTHAAFVRDHNLWVVNCQTTELKQLTHDGSEELLQGILDWVYQEELYGRGNFKGFWWSPNGEQIAFLQLNQSQVPHYRVSDSIHFGQSLEETRYPKAGEPIPTVEVWIVDVLSGQLRQVDLSGFPAEDRLVARVTWSPQGELWLQVLNRVQNRQDLVRVDPQTGAAHTLLSESSPGWIEVRGTPHFLNNGNFLWLSDLPHGRTHLYLIDAVDGSRSTLTHGDWDVGSLLSVANDDTTAYVSGNVSAPSDTQLIAVDLQQGTYHQLTSGPGTHTASVDASGNYFLDQHSSLTTPPISSLHSISGQMLRVIDAPTSDRHEYLDLRTPQLTTIPSRDEFPMQAMLMLPQISDAREPLEALPVLFYVYGGPQAPTVRNSWGGRNYWWHQMLCQQGFAVVLCDNRSALGRGVQDTWSIRGDLGRIELQDLEDAVRWVGAQEWADASRIGLWGWSYGGYLTSYAMTHSQLFRAGIAGAPVTDWRNYDAIYTERYMDLPATNPAGYESSSVVQAANALHGRLLIVHGERDDNVHMSNTLQLVHALQESGKQFDLMIYPKNRHGITDAQQRFHLHRMMTDFLHQRLKQTTPASGVP
ncbi:DPP IV N-terminal domain-containing protein [Aureliella helgolandensis]|uniref:Prolyl tripeptidyl peptidase n=1 Tax=Aureliella helgolandensis TaxID=2527968 RepID=A0A518G0N2_9BACT|nr:DPP IV N-terminal domain-containing protein [Aureliella helgolandensis]QDV22161.1 Prolyl tripeptidyl peptidase precursor [Aureliella helgolandensis]